MTKANYSPKINNLESKNVTAFVVNCVVFPNLCRFPGRVEAAEELNALHDVQRRRVRDHVDHCGHALLDYRSSAFVFAI
jgi:hypothetical protein